MQQLHLVDIFGNVHVHHVVIEQILVGSVVINVIAGVEIAHQLLEQRVVHVVIEFETNTESDMSYNLPTELWYRKIQKIKYTPTFENKIRIRES